MTALWALVLAGLVVLAVRAPVAGEDGQVVTADPTAPVLEVSVESGRLSLRAQETPLSKVLEAIGQRAGVKIVLIGDFDTPVTDMFVDVPVEEGLRRLTRWYSVVLIYGDAPGAGETLDLTEVRILAADRPRTEQAPVVRREDLRVGVIRPPSGTVTVNPGERGGDGAEVQVVARERGIWAMVRERGVPAIVDILRSVVTTDPSPRVRRAAMMALAREPGLLGVGELQQTATLDPSPLVRRTAIWALASIKNAEAGEALRGMLSDPDATIRVSAKSALAQWRERSP